jgi:integrase
MLSDVRIRKLKSSDRDRWISDSNGLYLRMRATGGRSWVLRRRKELGGNLTLGVWDPDNRDRHMSLAAARLKAAGYTGKVVNNLTLGELLEEWQSDVVAKQYRRPDHVTGYVTRLDAGLKAVKVRNLERVVVRQALKRYGEERGPVAARRLLSILKTALRFARDAGYIDASPIEGLSPDLVGGPESSRERVLTDAEIRALWHAESQHAPLLRFLLVTGQRIGEAQRADWSHVRGDRWIIPAEHAKNKRAHWCALTRQALRILATVKSDRELVFGTATDTGVQAWLRRWCEREKISPAFRPHDLRRTCATRLADLGVMPHVIEKILNHTMLGVMATYNRSEYEAERVEAMQRWADEFERIVAESDERVRGSSS